MRSVLRRLRGCLTVWGVRGSEAEIALRSSETCRVHTSAHATGLPVHSMGWEIVEERLRCRDGALVAAAREGGVLNAVPCPVRGDGLVAGGGQSPPNKLLKQGGKTRRDLLAHARRAR